MFGRVTVVALAVLLAAPASAARRRAARTGTLSIESTMAGAIVLVDGKMVGRSPVSVEVPPGAHHVTVRQLGHLEFTERVQIRAGERETVIADLLPFAGVIKVTASTPKAQVWVDGRAVGEAPLEREVDVGSHTVEVRAPGLPPHSEKILARAGSVHAIHAKLDADLGGDDLELTLVPLAPATAPAKDDEDPLSLAPLVPEPELSPPPAPKVKPARELRAVDPDALPPLGKPGVASTLDRGTPFYRTWWFWAGVGVVAAAGGAVVVKQLSGQPAPEPDLPIFYPGDGCDNCGSLGN